MADEPDVVPGRWRRIAAHSMRAYYVAIGGGVLVGVSAFLPWVYLGDVGIGGLPDMAALWVLALGALAVVLASLSIYTRKNSRHPLLVVGLAALGIQFLAYEWLKRVVVEQAWARSQALAIVGDVTPVPPPPTTMGAGVWIGWAGSLALVLFGLTIVFRQVASPYAVPEDDDV